MPAAGSLHAQPAAPPTRPPYLELRYDEDYRFLQDPARRTDAWDPVKYIPLRKEGWYLSLGGEGRVRHDFFRNPGFGRDPESPKGFLLQRYLFHADTHLGPHFRVFAQVQSGLENGRVGGPRVTDKNTLEVHQGFVDFTTAGRPGRSFTIRVGRQELEFGVGHFLSAAEVFNVRRSFDGVRLIGQAGKWTAQAVGVRLVETRPGAFDDVPDHGQTLWGAGLIGPHPLERHGNISIYYLLLDRKQGRFDQNSGPEIRHTLGSRSFGKHYNWDYTYEALYQWGSFRGGAIRAWAFAGETGYSLPQAPLSPRIGLRSDIASGDRDPLDPRLQTFNPMYPGTAYSGKIGLVGPANVIDATPNIRLRLHRRVHMLPECSFFWRQSLNDGTTASWLPPCARAAYPKPASLARNSLFRCRSSSTAISPSPRSTPTSSPAAFSERRRRGGRSTT